MTETTPRHLPINSILQDGKYEVLKVLGQGGFGITYLAKHKIFGEVALKELFLSSGTAHCSRENTTQKQVVAHFGSAQFQKFKDRFLGEAKTLYQLSGVKGVVNVLDHFEENDTVYFSMNFLSGDSLDKYVKKKNGISEAEGVRIIKSLAATLSEVHKRNVLHRDIKPANIIIDESGEAHFIDFGIARSYVEEVDETHTTFHSPRYSPPEQKIARSRMGPYSDVYSLGATAYFLFTGQPPQTMEERLLGDGYKSPKELVPSLSNTVVDAITRSLTIKDKERIQTADEFLLALSPIGAAAKKVLPIIPTNKENLIPNTPDVVDKTIIKPVSQAPIVDEKTVVDPDAGSIQKPIDDKTRVADLSIQEEISIDNEKTEIYEETPKEEKKSKKWLVIVGALAMAFLGLIFMIREKPPEPPIVTEIPSPTPAKKVLNLMVQDTFNQAIDKATITIYTTGQIVKRDSTGMFSLDITHNWPRLKDKTLRVSNTGFFSQELQIATLVNKKTRIQLTPDGIPNPQLFCDNLLGNWGNKKELLDFKVCEDMKGNSPEGLAYFNKKEAIWSSFQKEDGSIYIDFSFVDNDEELLFLVKEPFNKKLTKIELIKDGEMETFTRKKKEVTAKKTYIVKGRIVDNDGRAVIGATIKLPNSTRKRATVSNGKFYLELSEKEWKEIKNDNIEITYDGFYLKKIRFADIVNKNRYKTFELTPLPSVKSDKALPIYVNCRNLINVWVNNRGEQLFLENCNGGNGGKAIYKGIEKNWNYSQKGNRIHLKFIGSKEPLEFVVHNPSQKNNTYLELIREGSTPFKIGKGLIYSRKTKAKIFCENISRKWTRSKTFGSDKLEITGCNTVNPSGNAIYNGKPVTWLSSHIMSKGMTVTVKHDEGTLIFKVHDPLSKSKISLEMIENGKPSGKLFKK